MQVLLRDCVPEPQVTLHALHSDHCGLALVPVTSPIVKNKIILIIIIIIIIIIVIIIIITVIVVRRIDASS